VASTTLPLVYPSRFSRYCSRCATARVHHLGALEHEGQDQLARTESIADVLHRGEQDGVEHADRVQIAEREVDLLLDAVLAPVEYLRVDALQGRHPLEGIGGLGQSRGAAARVAVEMRDEPGERIRRAVEDELLSEAPRLRVDLTIGNDVRGVDDRGVQPGLDAVVQEHAVEHRPHLRREPEGDIRDPEHRQHSRKLALDGADAVDGLARRVDPLGFTGGERERQRIEDQLVRCKPELVARQVVDAAGDLELALGGARHTLLVDGECDDAGAVIAHQREHRVAAHSTVLQVDAVDDAASRVRLQRRVDHVSVGAVDHQWRVDAHLQRLHHGAHLLRLVAALGDRDAEVERVRAALDLRCAPPRGCRRNRLRGADASPRANPAR